MEYINKINSNEIINFLNQNNLKLGVYFDNDGLPLPPVELDESGIFIRCKIEKQESLPNKEIVKFVPTIQSKYTELENSVIVFLDDFSARTISSQNINLQDNWAKFMYSKFGEKYRTDYNNSITNEQAKTFNAE